jgi:NAD(P)-dependent dehydrogenase (short-subunit alcohol dehydrogenase family)
VASDWRWRASWAVAAFGCSTCLFGTWRLVQALLPALRRSSRPRVVVTSSGAGSHGDPALGLTARGGAAASYGVSKAALNALVATLAAELGSDLPVVVVCPGSPRPGQVRNSWERARWRTVRPASCGR